ncbi:hypothetical protein [Bacillus sp. FJAT-28004]|uniref:hypothetical protein n=1 Tax=Bacillus sp. FJAT-28004 TaxID=1679165 RepID=UPI0006B671E1|nr:hypothetical protein [Bacillus sp. FJAT-28004]
MKVKLLKLVLLCSCLVLISTGFSYKDDVDKHQKLNKTMGSLQEYVTVILNNEINSAINNKYGTDFLFHPEMVCETRGKEIAISGILNQNNESKRIKITLVKKDSLYEVKNILE